MKKHKLAIFASGSGTNAEAIIQYFEPHPDVEISHIYSNNPNAYVLERATNHGIPGTVFNKTEFHSPDFNQHLLDQGYDLLILAGFMWLVPKQIVASFPDKILNIHPALLPNYGGKGMYGHFVHEAVIREQEKESGITIHYVNEHYDEGDIIFQARCPVYADDTPDSLAARIHKLEHEHYPRVIAEVCREK